jgi:hypothetical protein
MSMPRSNSRSPTLRKLSGNRTFIITTRRITSGEELKSGMWSPEQIMSEISTATDLKLANRLENQDITAEVKTWTQRA